MLRRILALVVSFSMLLQQTGFAQIGAQPVVSSYMQSLLPVDAFWPVQVRSLSFDAVSGAATLYLDKGSNQEAGSQELEKSVDRLMDLFYTGLVLPNSSFWVNLRPDSQDQIIDPLLEKTDLGKILLEADLQLKKDLAALTSPKTPDGRVYWDKLYAKAESLFGQENAEIPTHTRPWIVPGEIIVKETPSGVYVYKAGLKVMLEQDYLYSAKEGQVQLTQAPAFDDPRLQQLNDYSTQLIRRSILPKLNRQVNASRRYAQLRQAYYCLVLAQWFKNKRFGSESLIKRIDSKDLSGLTSKNAWSRQTYFNDYKKSFENGEYAMEDMVRTSTGITVRKYFSGGVQFQAPPAAFSFQGKDAVIDHSLVRIQLPGTGSNDGGQAVIDTLLADLKSSSKSKIISAADRLSRSRDERVVTALGQTLLDIMDRAGRTGGSSEQVSRNRQECAEIAEALIKALGNAGSGKAVDFLWEAFQHPFPSELYYPNGGGGIAAPVWINVHMDVFLRCSIYRALGKIGGEKAFRLLMKGANSGYGIGGGMGYSARYPSSAIDGLAILGDMRALPLLEARVNSPYIGEHASRALSIITSMNEQSDMINQAAGNREKGKIRVKFFDTLVELSADELSYNKYQVTDFIHYMYFSKRYKVYSMRQRLHKERGIDATLQSKKKELSEVDMRVIRKYAAARMNSISGRIISLLGLDNRPVETAKEIESAFDNFSRDRDEIIESNRDGGRAAKDIGFIMRQGKDGGRAEARTGAIPIKRRVQAELSTPVPDSVVNNLGGVDLRVLPAEPVSAAMAITAVDPAALKQLAAGSRITDLDKEWQAIVKQLQAKSFPCDKVKEFVAVCKARQGSEEKLVMVQDMILDTIRMEEACAIETPAEEKELLVLLESI